MRIDGNTKIFGIMGLPVSHSLSPAMHNAAFEALGLNMVYVPFPVSEVEPALIGLRALGIGGVSVTIPHKQAVLPFLDFIDPVAERIGAVNTIVMEPNGRLLGYNTDWRGANRALEEQVELKGKKVVLLGAGGSARAIGFGIKEAGAECLLCSRTPERGMALAADLGCEWHPLADVTSLQGEILVNATSVGMAPDTASMPLPANKVGDFKVVMDIVYSPLETSLLRQAKENGCIAVNGLAMLLYQGAVQFELWTGRTAPLEVMRAQLMEKIG